MERRLPAIAPRAVADRGLRVVALAVLALVVAACGSLPFLPVTPPGGQTALVTVEYRGGHCRQGECRSVVTILADGTVRRDDGPLVAVPSQTLAALVDAIRGTDFPALLARPFTGECPVNYDGQEAVYTIETPRDGRVVIASCTVEVDPTAPLFATIERIVELAPYPSG